jgi:hypothetical protein
MQSVKIMDWKESQLITALSGYINRNHIQQKPLQCTGLEIMFVARIEGLTREVILRRPIRSQKPLSKGS